MLISYLRKKFDSVVMAANTVFTRIATNSISSANHQVQNQIDAAYDKLQNATKLIYALEFKLDIQDRWMTSTPKFKEFYQENILTNYMKALDKLECLVVMWLFELMKMSTSGTGM